MNEVVLMDAPASKARVPSIVNNFAARQASIVGGCLVSFNADISMQDKQDIEDCFAYAELAANRQSFGNASAKKWFDYYQGRLLKVGFKLTAIVPSDPIVVKNVRELSSATFDIIGSVGSRRLGQLAKETYERLKVDNVAWDYFRGDVKAAELTISKFAPCEAISTGEIAVCLFGLRYKTTVLKEDVFFWTEVDKVLTLIPDGGIFVFDREFFSNCREAVYEKIDRYSR